MNFTYAKLFKWKAMCKYASNVKIDVFNSLNTLGIALPGNEFKAICSNITPVSRLRG